MLTLHCVLCVKTEKKDYLSIYHLFFGGFISHISSRSKLICQLLCVPLNSKCAAWINGLVLSKAPSEPWEFSLCTSSCVFYEFKTPQRRRQCGFMCEHIVAVKLNKRVEMNPNRVPKQLNWTLNWFGLFTRNSCRSDCTRCELPITHLLSSSK